MATRQTRAKQPLPDDVVDDTDPDSTDWGVQQQQPRALAFNESASPAELSPAERVAAMLQHAAGVDDATVRVYRVMKGGKWEYCQTYQLDEFEAGDLGMIRSQFGAGDYAIQVFGTTAGGGKGIISRTFIAVAPEPWRPPQPSASTSASGNTDLAQLAAILQQGQQQMMEVLRETLTNRPDPMASMREALSMMTMMRSAMGLDQQPAQKSSISEIIAAVRELREVAGELDPNAGDKEPSLLGLGSQLMGMVKEGMARQAGPSLLPVPPVQVPASLDYPPIQAPSPPLPQVSPDAGEGRVLRPDDTTSGATPRQEEIDVNNSNAARNPKDEADKVMALLHGALKLAAEGADPERGAELLYGTDKAEGLPDELLDLMTLPDWWTMLTQVPQFAELLKPHEAWIREVRDIMMVWDAQDYGDASDDSSASVAAPAPTPAPES